MKYCTKCGTEVQDNSAFCGACGNRMENEALDSVVAEEQPQRVTRQRKKMHCPKCKGISIMPTTEAHSHTGASYRVSKRISVGGANTSNHTYWLCKDCGTKFRNIQEVEADYAKNNKFFKICFGVSIFLAIMTLICAIGLPEIVGLLIFTLVLWGGMAMGLKVRTNKLKKERDYLRTNCFD